MVERRTDRVRTQGRKVGVTFFLDTSGTCSNAGLPSVLQKQPFCPKTVLLQPDLAL